MLLISTVTHIMLGNSVATASLNFFNRQIKLIKGNHYKHQVS